MPQGQPTARVFIWYPHKDNYDDTHVGHASMYIGNYEVGLSFELSLDPNSPDHVMTSALERNYGLAGIHYNDNYVSWWPGGGGRSFQRVPANNGKFQNGLWSDCDEEESEPHVVYDLYGLNVAAMRACWKETREKPGASYQFVRKSCATIVMRVLEAGGALTKIGKLNNLWFGNRLYWTPKRVAQVCNQLRDKDLAVKTKAGNCPHKGDNVQLPGFVIQALGMR
jgi:hypothetical protein